MENIYKIAESVGSNLNADIIVYSGEIHRRGANEIIKITESTDNKNVLFFLNTAGGDADAAFKIARRLQEKYEKFSLYVYDNCKSAGTLIAVGTDEIVMSDYAEFGPLDIQLKEKDEILSFNSGLNVTESLWMLKNETMQFFRNTWLELVGNAGLSTKTAAELAIELSIRFISPIASQIDPLRLSQTQRAINIALAYGEKLIEESRGNLLSPKELNSLVLGYPDHGFVIDYKESRKIFKKVRKPNDLEENFGKALSGNIKSSNNQLYIKKIYPDTSLTLKKGNDKNESASPFAPAAIDNIRNFEGDEKS